MSVHNTVKFAGGPLASILTGEIKLMASHYAGGYSYSFSLVANNLTESALDNLVTATNTAMSKQQNGTPLCQTVATSSRDDEENKVLAASGLGTESADEKKCLRGAVSVNGDSATVTIYGAPTAVPYVYAAAVLNPKGEVTEIRGTVYPTGENITEDSVKSKFPVFAAVNDAAKVTA